MARKVAVARPLSSRPTRAMGSKGRRMSESRDGQRLKRANALWYQWKTGGVKKERE